MVKNNDFPTMLKKALVWALIAVAAVGALSLLVAALCLKGGDPLSTASTAALVCVGLGGALACGAPCRGCSSYGAGLMGGGLFLAVMVLLSLCVGGTASIYPYIAAGAGVSAGLLLKGKKPSHAKQLKKLRAK